MAKPKHKIFVTGWRGRVIGFEDKGFGNRMDSFYTGLTEFFSVIVGGTEDRHFSNIEDAKDTGKNWRDQLGRSDVRIKRIKV